MQDSDKILRYLYLGTTDPFFIRKNKPLDIDKGRIVLAPIKTLVEATNSDDPEVCKLAETVTLKEQPLDMVVRAMKSGSLIRHDECIFTLAFLARTFTKPEDKHKVYDVLPKLIEQTTDLFQFAYFYKILAPASGGKGFGHGIKVAITKWYDKHSAEELARLLAKDARCHNWSHRDLFRQARVVLTDGDKMQVLLAVKGVPKTKKGGEAATNGDKKDVEPQVESEAATNGDKKGVEPPVESAALKIYNHMKRFKSLKDPLQIASILETHKYSIELVPAQMLQTMEVWEKLLKNMPYQQILRVAPLLQDFRLLTDIDTPLSVEYGKVLNMMTSVAESKVHPIYVYQIMRLFEERQRYRNTVKEAIHAANNLNVQKRAVNKTVVEHFYSVLNESLNNYKRTGLRFLVTLDLRTKQSKKRVFCNRLMSCEAAYILLTLPMFKREPHMEIMSFTENPKELVEVHLTREMNFFQASDHIRTQAGKKTKVKLTRSIEYAKEKKKPVDVFITIVDSLIRVNPLRRSPVEELRAYNNAMNQQARFIVINLCRHKQDLDHTSMASTQGVLEITGCSEETPKLIDAYVKHHFT